ncbi:MAG: MbcA/ParS/Xre antitoxin family protein [Candidatus Sungiibacteriota bacterium]
MKNLALFGKYVGKAAHAAGEVLVKEDVAKWLGRPLTALGGKSPIEVIWRDGARGFRQVIDILERIKSGSFS